MVIYPKKFNNWTVSYVVELSSLSMVKKFLFFSLSEGGKGLCFCCVFCPLSTGTRVEKGIRDYIAHRPIIQVFTVGIYR